MSSFPTHAMIFAAGFGTRMRPITDTIPKPLVPVAGKTLLDYSLDQLANAGVKKAVVNCHYKAEQIEAHVKKRLSTSALPDIIVSKEDEILETGGGLVKALPHLGNTPFFCINSDIIWVDKGKPALERMAEFWDPLKMDVLMLLHPVEKAIGYDEPGNFFLNEENIIKRPEHITVNPPYVFTGVQIFSPNLLAGKEVKKFSLRDVYWQHKADDGLLKRIYGIVHEGDWLHIGTPEGVTLAEIFLAAKVS